MKLICLTGEKGVGKSTIIDKIEEFNLENLSVFKTDEFIKGTYLKNHLGYKKINDCFGSEYNDEEGIDRKKLAKAIYEDKKIYNKLTQITNELIKNWIEDLKKNNLKKIIIIELAIYLKFEKEFKSYFDKVILIKNYNKKKENHVSDFLDQNEIEPDFTLKHFEKNLAKKIIQFVQK